MAKKKSSKTQAPESSQTLLEALGIDHIIHNERLRFIVGVILFLTTVYIGMSFVSFFTTGAADQSYIDELYEGELQNQQHEFTNSCGSIGAYLSCYCIKRCFGIPAFLIVVFTLLASLHLMKAYRIQLLKWFLALMVAMVWSSVTFAKFLAPLFAESHFNPGGDHGQFVCQQIEGLVGAPGLTAILALVAIAFLTYVSAETILVIRKILNPSKFIDHVKFKITNNDPEENEDSYERLIETAEDPSVFDDPRTQTVEFPDGGEPKGNDGYGEMYAPTTATSDSAPADVRGGGPADDGSIDLGAPDAAPQSKHGEPGEPGFEIETAADEEAADSRQLVTVGDQELEPYDPKRDLENYHYPTLDLLKKYENDGKPYIDMEEQTKNKNRIVEVLRTFGVEISTIKATVGPTITLYEITLSPGIRISKVRSLEDDIALSLSALGIRIIAPIPGKGTIGIEVPNAKPSIVSMESILNSKKFQETTMELPCAMGKTITNEVFMFDLAKAPHLLVAGATGQGKSVGLNAILTSLLYKKHPAEMKIVLVDPKMVEFSIYKTIERHFLAALPEESENPIITDTTKVVRTLNSLCVEMDARYELLMTAGERNIKDYNKKFKERRLNPEKGHRYMPYIVVVIDEYGDLIMTAGKEIELPIARIAQKARAVGIHMIIATQRPTTNIITGTIKANFPGRIAFKVSQGIDSKTILDRMGANQLIGRGDMLYLQGNDPIRVQCAFVDTPEVVAINEFIAAQQGYLEPYELPEPKMEDGEPSESREVDMTHLDPMFEDAARLIVTSQSGSTSLIQRKFSIGYNRAGRLMDQLEKAGVVGQAYGSKPREVLIQDEVSLQALIDRLKN